MLVLYPLFLCSVVDAARILGVYPMPSVSHQMVFRALTMELAKRGHELVVITTDPALPKDRPKDNITEIHTERTYNLLKTKFLQKSKPMMKRGVIRTMEMMTSDQSQHSIFSMVAEIFNEEEVLELLNDKTQKFDLVIAEAFTNFHFIFAKIFDAPLIAFSSFYGFAEIFETAGTVSRHPVLYPNLMRNKFNNLSFFEQITEIYNEYRIKRAFAKREEYEYDLLKSKFGEDAPTIDELKGLVSMVFLNSFPIFDHNRPVPPNVVHLGALHMQPLKELPQELQSYLDNSKRGVVYVSLGTNVRPSMMDQDLLDAFLNAFKQIPYDILWKFDGDNLGPVSENVKIQKWFPQRDLLVHPNIKAFVTQGGLQSTDEAIDAGVPLVGIPFLGDQWYNANRYVELGIGVKLDSLTLTADDIVKGVKIVTSDESYRQNLKKLKAIMYDTPQTPIERAVWWTEYVIRHKGAHHLKSPAANMSYREYFMVDFILCVLAALSVILFTFVLIIYYVISLFKTNPNKIKFN